MRAYLARAVVDGGALTLSAEATHNAVFWLNVELHYLSC
jgi:hypothetical protein